MHTHLFKTTLGSILLAMAISLIFICRPSMAQTDKKRGQNEILVIGTGIIVGGNVAKAKETAISQALILGVEDYLTKRLGELGMINNFPRLNIAILIRAFIKPSDKRQLVITTKNSHIYKLIHNVIPGAKEEIENFNILAEEQSDTLYKILVRVKINENVMEQKLRETGLILMKGPPIKILFLVSQVEPEKEENAYWWGDPESVSGLTATELALHRVFQERGLRPINRLLNVPEGDFSPGMSDLNLSDENASQWGVIFAADVVIHGRCEIFAGFGVILRLSVVDVKKGLLIYQDTEIERAEADPDNREQIIESVEKVISKIAIRMIPPIIKAMEPPEENIQQLEISLKGLKNFQQFRAYRDFLKKEIKGVKSVRQTRIRGDAMSILVEFIGDREEFLDKASSHKNLPFEVELIITEEGEIVIKIQEIS